MPKLLRFEGPTMEHARRRVREHFGGDLDPSSIVRSGKERYGGYYGFFQRERFVIEVTEPAPRPAAVDLSGLVNATADTVAVDGFERELDRELELVIADARAAVSATNEVLVDPSSIASPAMIAAPLAAKVARTDPVGIELALSEADLAEELPRHRPSVDGAEIARPYPHPAGGALSRGCDANRHDEHLLAERLRAARLAAHLVPGPETPHYALALAHRLGVLEVAPPLPSAPGDVVVLLGDLAACDTIARRLIEEGHGHHTVCVVSHRRVAAGVSHPRARTPEEAGAFVLEQRMQRRAGIVLVDGGCRGDFVTTTIDGLHATAVWAVVASDSSIDDLAALAERAHGLDALCLFDTLAALQPGTLIDAGWPIAFVDGWRATPLALAARLLESIGCASADADNATVAPTAPPSDDVASPIGTGR